MKKFLIALVILLFAALVLWRIAVGDAPANVEPTPETLVSRWPTPTLGIAPAEPTPARVVDPMATAVPKGWTPTAVPTITPTPTNTPKPMIEMSVPSLPTWPNFSTSSSLADPVTMLPIMAFFTIVVIFGVRFFLLQSGGYSGPWALQTLFLFAGFVALHILVGIWGLNNQQAQLVLYAFVGALTAGVVFIRGTMPLSVGHSFNQDGSVPDSGAFEHIAWTHMMHGVGLDIILIVFMLIFV